jgi:branched-chain amino acid transport system permease protein
MKIVLRRHYALIALLLLALVPLASPGLISAYYIDLLTKVLIFGIALLGYDILAGYTGLVSLGHALFFGLGGYCAACSLP